MGQQLWIIIKALLRGFGDRLSYPVPMTLDSPNPKSIGFDTSFKSFRLAVFVKLVTYTLMHIATHPQPHTHIHRE